MSSQVATPVRWIGFLPAGLQLRAGSLRLRVMSSGFLRNVLVMLGGTVLGQMFSVIASPALTRIYSPAEFGYLNVYGSILGLFTVLASLRYEMAIPIAVSEIEAANLFGVCSVALLSTTGIVAALAWLVPPQMLAAWPWASALSQLLQHAWLLPVGFFCLGGYYVLNFVATRAGAFKTIARTRISQGLAGPASQVVLGLLGTGASGLAMGFVIGQSSGTALLFSRLVLTQREIFGQISLRGMAAAARRYIGFPLVSSWSAMLEMACNGAVVSILIASLFSPSVAGFMLLTDRVVGRPLLMLSSSLLQVFVGEAGHAITSDPAKLQRRFWQVVTQQFAITATWLVVANMLAAFAFPALFGARWATSATYLVALSGGYLALSTLHPVSHTLQLLQRQVAAASLQGVRLVLLSAGMILSWRAGMSAVQALWVASAIQMLTCATILTVMGHAIRKVQVAATGMTI